MLEFRCSCLAGHGDVRQVRAAAGAGSDDAPHIVAQLRSQLRIENDLRRVLPRIRLVGDPAAEGHGATVRNGGGHARHLEGARYYLPLTVGRLRHLRAQGLHVRGVRYGDAETRGRIEQRFWSHFISA